MRRLRFSIASLLVLVLFFAVAIGALREATDIWDSSVFSLTLGLLLLAILLAVHRAGRSRAYWLEFAMFGSAYLGASHVPPIESRLITTKGLAYLDAKLPGRNVSSTDTLVIALDRSMNVRTAVTALALASERQPQASTNLGVVRLWDATTGRLLSGSGGTSENFMRIGHSLVALVLAFVGGHVSRVLCSRE